eukprot:365682-Chlamydomonas_euryale.AAC.3
MYYTGQGRQVRALLVCEEGESASPASAKWSHSTLQPQTMMDDVWRNRLASITSRLRFFALHGKDTSCLQPFNLLHTPPPPPSLFHTYAYPPHPHSSLCVSACQGKFQLALLPMAGHAVHEDEATRTAEALLQVRSVQRPMHSQHPSSDPPAGCWVTLQLAWHKGEKGRGRVVQAVVMGHLGAGRCMYAVRQQRSAVPLPCDAAAQDGSWGGCQATLRAVDASNVGGTPYACPSSPPVSSLLPLECDGARSVTGREGCSSLLMVWRVGGGTCPRMPFPVVQKVAS